jgi:hypothetical protein
LRLIPRPRWTRTSPQSSILQGAMILFDGSTLFKSVLLGLPHNAFIMQLPDLA